jgi:hypothetical protein
MPQDLARQLRRQRPRDPWRFGTARTGLEARARGVLRGQPLVLGGNRVLGRELLKGQLRTNRLIELLGRAAEAPALQARDLFDQVTNQRLASDQQLLECVNIIGELIGGERQGTTCGYIHLKSEYLQVPRRAIDDYFRELEPLLKRSICAVELEEQPLPPPLASPEMMESQPELMSG